ncbi:MAG: YjjG family noncanonical pyrimidine nucleotidase [Cellulosilyticaceae bacterium]
MIKYDTILLDIDGTLLDFEKAEQEAFKAMLAYVGENYEAMHYETYSRINKGLWEALERGEIEKEVLRLRRFELFLEAIGNASDALEVSKYYEKALSEGAYPIQHALEICEILKKNCRMAVVTNGIKVIQDNRLHKSGLIQYFDQVFISEELGVSKPHKLFFDKVFEAMGEVNRERTLIIGDSLTADIKGGNTAGIKTCWFNPKGIAAREDIKSDYEIKDLKALRKIVGV